MKKDNQTDKRLSRRNFLKTAGSAAAVAGLAAGGIGLSSTNAEAAGDALPKKWDETNDVVIVGSGFAGLAAAIEAKNAGAKEVVVLDKMPMHGGHSIINGGDFCAPGTKLQKENGVEDSPELMLKDMLKAGSYLNHPELARMVAYHAKDAIEWTESYLGARYTKLNYQGGHSVKRANGTINSSGSEVVNKELAKARELGVIIQLRTKLVKFLSNNDGRIVGIEVRKNYKFPDESTGKTAFIKAKTPEPVEMSQCVTCHGATAKLAEKTKDIKPSNPHTSPHYGTDLDCNLCHHQHAKSENYCVQCHKFDFVVP